MGDAMGQADEPQSDAPSTQQPDGIVAEFLYFLKTEKKWWLTPIIVVLALVGLLLVFTRGSALAPFIYTIF